MPPEDKYKCCWCGEYTIANHNGPRHSFKLCEECFNKLMQCILQNSKKK